MEIETFGPLLGWAREIAFKRALLAKYGVLPSRAEVASKEEEVRRALLCLGGRGVLKVPGRSFPCETPEEGVQIAEALFAEGIEEVLIEEQVETERAFSLTLLLLPLEVQGVLLAEDLGSGDRSEVTVDPLLGFMPFQGRRVALDLGLPSDLMGQFVEVLGKVFSLFWGMGFNRMELTLGLSKRWAFVLVDVGTFSPWPCVLEFRSEGLGLITGSEKRAIGLVDLLEGQGVKVAKVLILPRGGGSTGRGVLQQALEKGFKVLDWGLYGVEGVVEESLQDLRGLLVLAPEREQLGNVLFLDLPQLVNCCKSHGF